MITRLRAWWLAGFVIGLAFWVIVTALISHG